VPDTLPVHVNREEIHGLEVPPAFEATGAFDVRIVNHGNPVHVHLHLDDDLSTVASLDATNHYVQGETERRVQVAVTGEGDVRGKLKVVTGYGATTRYVDVDLAEPTGGDDSVEVDEALAKPAPPEQGPTADPSTVGKSRVPVLAVGGVAVLAAAAVLLFVRSLAVTLGALAVILAVAVGVSVVLLD